MRTENIVKEKIIIKIPELSAIVLIIGAYLRFLPDVLQQLRGLDLFQFLFVLILASAVVVGSCALLLIQHSIRIAQEELHKSRILLEQAVSALSKAGLQINNKEGQST